MPKYRPAVPLISNHNTCKTIRTRCEMGKHKLLSLDTHKYKTTFTSTTKIVLRFSSCFILSSSSTTPKMTPSSSHGAYNTLISRLRHLLHRHQKTESSLSSPSLASPRRKDRTLGTTMPTIVRESMRHAIFKSASRG